MGHTFHLHFSHGTSGSDVCNLGKVHGKGAKHLTLSRNRPRRTARNSSFPKRAVIQSSCLPFHRISPIASVAPAPDLDSSPPSRSRRAPKSSAILGRFWIQRRKKTTRSRTNI